MLDFVVVMAAIGGKVEGVPNVSAMRSIRVLRPLKSVSKMPSMKIMVQSILHSLKMLSNVAAFLCFIFCLFAIIGTNFFMGAFDQRCRLTPAPIANGETWPIDSSQQWLCSSDTDCLPNTYCATSAFLKGEFYTKLLHHETNAANYISPKLNYGFTN